MGHLLHHNTIDMLDSLILLTTANPADVAEGANVISKLAGQFDVQWHLLIAQIINFALVAFLLYRFAFKPILKTLEERQKKIADGLRYADEMEFKLKDAERQHAEIMHEAALEKKDLLETAREQAKNYAEKQAQEALLKTEYTMKKAEEAIALEKQKMLYDARKELGQLVVMTSEKVLAKDLTKEDRALFNETAAKELALN